MNSIVTRTQDGTGIIVTGQAFSSRASAAIDNHKYNEKTQTLTLAYVGGGSYNYFGVTKTTFEDYLRSDSKGAFVNASIKPHYRVDRVERVD